MQYGAILKACRERVGWNQEELAHHLMINQSDVSKYENNMKEPQMSMFQKWAIATQSQDVLVAFIAGMDGINILTNILMSGVPIAGVISLLGGWII